MSAESTVADDIPGGRDLLFDTPDNPRPQGMVSGMMRTPDGCELRYARCAAAGRPLKGTVILLSGRNECIEKYYETIADLSKRGLGTAMMDWRGQGGSGGRLRDRNRGYIKSFNRYAEDLHLFIEQIVLPDCRPPYFLLAHSTGSLVALLAAPRLGNQVQRMVLIAPLLELTGIAISMRVLKNLSGFLRAVGLGRLYLGSKKPSQDPPDFSANRLTSDEERFQRNRDIYRVHPELGLGGPTATWLNAACKAALGVTKPAFRAKIRVPTLFIAAGADRVVSTKAIEDYAARMRLGSIVTVDGGNHELLQEKDFYREQTLAALDGFIPGSDEPFDTSSSKEASTVAQER